MYVNLVQNKPILNISRRREKNKLFLCVHFKYFSKQNIESILLFMHITFEDSSRALTLLVGLF
jgi:hypothetical protein